MGGFRFNGCGVTDHFNNIKILGVYNCSSCKKSTEFVLAEANQKIDVFWIPTLTLKSRYAVMCKKCKTGEFCSTEWASYLLNQTEGQDIIFESEAKAKGWSPETRSFQGAAPQAQSVPPSAPPQSQNPFPNPHEHAMQPPQAASPPGASGGSDAPTFFKCSYCGVTQMREGNCCAYCGKPAPGSPKQNASSDTGVVTCPSCGNRQEAGSKFCFQCGKKLASEPSAELSAERSCPRCGAKVKAGMLFCMECGTKIMGENEK